MRRGKRMQIKKRRPLKQERLEEVFPDFADYEDTIKEFQSDPRIMIVRVAKALEEVQRQLSRIHDHGILISQTQISVDRLRDSFDLHRDEIKDIMRGRRPLREDSIPLGQYL